MAGAAAGRGATATLPLEIGEDVPTASRRSASSRRSWDYRASLHSARGHPLAPLRDELRAQGLPDARTVARVRDGSASRYAGIVICRQRPGTASGVMFMTLEDETGFVNLVVWPQVFEEYAQAAKTASLLGVTGRLQKQQNVVHIVVQKTWKPELDTRSFPPWRAGISTDRRPCWPVESEDMVQPATERAYFVIADISGYTSYLVGSELDHAHDISLIRRNC